MNDNDKCRDLVVKSNDFIQAFLSMTHNEYKFTIYLLSKVTPNDESLVKEVSVKEFQNLFEISGRGTYTCMKNFGESLIGKSLSLEREKNGRWKYISWFDFIEYIPEKAVVRACFSNSLKSHILNLNVNYTKYLIKNIRKLNTFYAIRLYELLIQFRKTKFKIITVENLRYMLGISDNEYIRYYDFKKKVLLASQERINKNTDLDFDFDELKEGRKVEKIKFFINECDEMNYYLDEPKTESISGTEIDNKEEVQKIINNFNSKYRGRLDPILTKELVKIKGLDCVKECVEKFVDYADNANEVERMFYAFTKRYGTDEAYTKGSVYKNMAKNKPIQTTNYKQREYDNDFFDSLYDNFTLEEIRAMREKGEI